MRYRLTDGTYAPNRDVNNHHVFFEKRWYKSQVEHRFRNLGGLVLPMHVPPHNDLHANIPPPPKPSKQLMERVINFSHDMYGSDAYDEFTQITHFIGDVANSSWSPERADEAFRIHENLVAQSTYIELGRAVEVVGHGT